MEKKLLMDVIDVAAGRKAASLVIKNGRVVDVYNGRILDRSVAIEQGLIAGIGDYEGVEEMDAAGAYIIPGLIEAHIHIESSFLTPAELGSLIVPLGTTTIIADPHEIVNVCGIAGFDYMISAARGTDLDIKLQVPSCVPATPFENSGAILDSEGVARLLERVDGFGLGEMMNFPGVIQNDEEVIGKLAAAKRQGKIIDGHAPFVFGKEACAYAAGGIKTDHECSTVAELLEKTSLGMYVQLRQGSATNSLRTLLKGVTPFNSRRCLLCSDDRQPKDVLEMGHLDNHLRICVEEGIDPITAIQKATLNPAECYGLTDRGAIAPGLRADLVLVRDLKDFHVEKVFIEGSLKAENHQYFGKKEEVSTQAVGSSVRVQEFSEEQLNLNSASPMVHVIEIVKGELITKKRIAAISLTETGDFHYDPKEDIVKVVCMERHHRTGNIAVGLLGGYGLKKGAVAQTIAHDSHNIIAAGTNNKDIETAIKALTEMGGGIVIANQGQVVEQLPLPIAGLMSDRDAQWVAQRLKTIEDLLHEDFGVKTYVEPLMTLAFMSLPVIPELKITDKGLFDVTTFSFIPIEAEK